MRNALLFTLAVACGGSTTASSTHPSQPPSKSKEDNKLGEDAVGKKAPPFTTRSPITSETINFQPASGRRPTILGFFATWSEPGKVLLIRLSEVQRQLGEKNIDILAVSIDDEPKGLPDFVKLTGAKFPVGWDDGHKIADRYTINGEPMVFIIDKDGVIRHRHFGFHDSDPQVYQQELRPLMRY